MDTNKNITQTSNNENLKRKKLIITVIISVVIFCIIILAYTFISIFIIPRIKQEKNISEQKKQISEYLQEKYNDEFNIKFSEKGYAQKIHGTGEYAYACGTDKNIEEYSYVFTSKKNSDLKGYIIYSYNIEENSSDIFEKGLRAIMGRHSVNTAVTYEDALKYYDQKMIIKDSVEKYLKKEYNINWSDYTNCIFAEAKKSIKKENILNNISEYTDLYNNLVKLLYNNDVSILLEYKDASIYVDKDSTIKTTSEMINYIESTY